MGPFKEVKGFRSDVETQYHYEQKPFETEKALLRAAELRLKKMLETEKKVRSQHRLNRSGVPTVGIVGYTNAGKTSLMNRLTDAGRSKAYGPQLYLCVCEIPIYLANIAISYVI